MVTATATSLRGAGVVLLPGGCQGGRETAGVGPGTVTLSAVLATPVILLPPDHRVSSE